jgi:hypothetical protein
VRISVYRPKESHEEIKQIGYIGKPNPKQINFNSCKQFNGFWDMASVQ